MLLNLAKKVTLALTSNLFDVLLLPLCGTKIDNTGEATPAPGDKIAKLAEFSEMTVQRNSLRGQDSQAVKLMSLAKAFHLSKGSITFNGI
jgi:hypothetical protein